tara:strand:- start:9 stop:149 length:141 start_codon:yes stop_codon:yes gene_type:complete
MKLSILICSFLLGCATTAAPAEAETVYTPDGTYTCTVYDDGTRICF